MNKKTLLKNLWDFTPAQIADAVRSGVVTEYELKTQSQGQYTPKLRREVKTLLSQPAQPESEAPAEPEAGIAPQPVFEQQPVQPVVQPAPQPAVQPAVQPAPQPAVQPFDERTVITEPGVSAPITLDQQTPHYSEPKPPAYPEPPMSQQYGVAPQPAEQWGTPPPPAPPKPNPGMFEYKHGEYKPGGFSSLFSFYGRIGRMDYFLSILAYIILESVIGGVIGWMSVSGGGDVAEFAFIPLLLIIPLYWFNLAQAVKRCHDLGHSGWWIFIPFYGFWLLFVAGQNYPNKYGPARL